MRKYIIKRILISIVILFLVAFVIYALMRCLPTSYVEAMARQKSMQPNSKSFEEWMEQLTRMYNLDVGIVPGFFKWLGQMLTFNFGDSWLWTKPVTEVFNSCVWISFFMGLIAFVLEIIIAIPLGVIAATKQYSKTDYVISVLALAGISLPTFFFASLLKLVFSVKLGWVRPVWSHRPQSRAALGLREAPGHGTSSGSAHRHPGGYQCRFPHALHPHQHAGGAQR